MDQVKIGKFIAALRKARGLTQEALGEQLGVTNKTVSRWETGAYMPDVGKLQDLAAILGLILYGILRNQMMIYVEAKAFDGTGPDQ